MKTKEIRKYLEKNKSKQHTTCHGMHEKQFYEGSLQWLVPTLRTKKDLKEPNFILKTLAKEQSTKSVNGKKQQKYRPEKE